MIFSTNGQHEARVAPDPSEFADDKLDRKLFYLSSFFQTSQELTGLLQPSKIIEKFLLMAMGLLGVSRGVIALVNRVQNTGTLVGRGIPKQSLTALKKNIIPIYEQVSSLLSTEDEQIPHGLRALHQPPLNASLLPFTTTLILPWAINDHYAGFVALGEKITIQQDLSPAEYSALTNLLPLLTTSLKAALLTTNVQQLNSELQRSNQTLASTVSSLENKEEELDRQIFRLRSINEINTELRTITAPEKILESFLLHALGSQGMRQGFIVLLCRPTQELLQVHRGMPWSDLTPEETDRILFRALSAVTAKTLEPLTYRHVLHPVCLAKASTALPIPDRASLFLLDRETLGLIGMSNGIRKNLPDDTSTQLFETQIANFMVYLKNALAFSTITKLNQNLQQRNQALQNTIGELTRAHQAIDLMEKTREKIRRTLVRESYRIQRATGFDFILIITVAVLLGLIFNLKNPNGISIIPNEWSNPHIPSIGLTEVLNNQKNHTAILIDARPQEFFKLGHIQGAINLSPALFDVMYAMHLEKEDLERPIIVYGRTISRHYDQDIAYRLGSRDHEHVKIFLGGYREWEKKIQPLSR